MRQVDEVTASEKRGPEVQDAFNSACVCRSLGKMKIDIVRKSHGVVGKWMPRDGCL